MRIFYDVKKRRIIIRFAITVIALFSFVLILISFSSSPTNNLPLASSTDFQTPNALKAQSTRNKSAATAASTRLPEITSKEAVVSGEKSQGAMASALPSTSKTPKPSSIAEKNTPTISKAAKKDTATTSTVSVNKKASGSLQIMYFSSNVSSSANTITPMFKLINNTTSAIKLSELKIRYYLTVDSDITQSFWCDWSTIGAKNVYGNFMELSITKSNADHCLEIGFSNTAGVIESGKTIEIQTRFSKDNWSDFSQSNDYSFNPSKGFVSSNKITLYEKGKLIFGKEP